MTELSDKLDKIAAGGYRTEELARHMIKGQQRIHDYDPILADINDEMKHLTLDVLTELYEHVKYLRKRQQILPETVVIDEGEMPVDAGHARRMSPHGQAEASGGKVAKPVPSEAETPANSTGIGGDCPHCGVEDVPLYKAWVKGLLTEVCEKCLEILP